MALLVQSTVDPTASVRRAVESLDRDLPLRHVSPLPAAVYRRVWFLHVFTRLFLGFAMIALLMASIGLYAVMAHATGSRTQEIGVRMALGANARNIMMLIMKRGIWQIVAGLALGMAAAFPATRLMSSLPIGVSADVELADRRLGFRSHDLSRSWKRAGRRGTVRLLVTGAESGGAGSGQGYSVRIGRGTVRPGGLR